MKKIQSENKKISKCKKLIIGMLLLALFMTLPTTNILYAKEKKIAVPNLPHKGCDELGIKNIQETKYSKTTYFRWETVEDKKEVEFYYALHIYAEKNGKISRVKSISADKFTKGTQKLLKKCSMDGACLDYNCENVYVPTYGKNNMTLVYKVSLKTGKKQKVDLGETYKKKFNTPKLKTTKQGDEMQPGLYPGEAKLKSISKDKIAICVEVDKQDTDMIRNKSGELEKVVGSSFELTKVFLVDVKKQKVITMKNCFFSVYSINEKYISGLQYVNRGNLCIQSWIGKVKKVVINNPEEAGDTLGTADIYRYVHTTFLSGNKVYFSTRAGIFSYNMKTKKIKTILDREKSKELKKYKYVRWISMDKKKQLEILVSRGWRSSYKLIKIV